MRLFRSEARFQADAQGRVHLARQAPLDGGTPAANARTQAATRAVLRAFFAESLR